MDEVEEVTMEELANWLVEEGLAERLPGYGHATGNRLAYALLHRYRITPRPAWED